MERISYGDLPKGMFEKLLAIENLIKDSTLDYHLLEIMRLRIGQLNGCAYCVDMHHKELKSLGESDLGLSSICVWHDAPYFSEKEQAVLAYAESLTLVKSEANISHTFNELVSFYSKQEISLLSLAITQINTWTRLMRAFDFEPGKYQVKSEAIN